MSNCLIIVFKNLIDQKLHEPVFYYYNNETTITDILNNYNVFVADFSNYYSLSNQWCFNEKFLPFIIKSDDKLYWKQYFNETYIVDFFNTHNIKDNTIYIQTGIPQAGGPGLKDFMDIWEQLYPVINQIGNITGLILGIKEFKNWISSLFKDSKEELLPPHPIFEYILRKEEWNHFELAKKFNLNLEDTKRLLKISGFKWDNSKKIYVLSVDKEKLEQKIKNLNMLNGG